MSIKAWLDGDDVDLRCLADLFPYRGDGSFWINRQGDGRFFLSAPELDHPPAGVTHLQVTTALLAKANGIGAPRARRGVVCRQTTRLMCCCAGDEGFVALRRRSAGSGVKPPYGALAEDWCAER